MVRDLTGPRFPEGSLYLYGWFCQLGSSRSSNGFGPNPLSAMEILAWSQLTANYILPWEFDLLRRLDHKWLEIYGELHKPDPPKQPVANNRPA